VTPVPIPDAAVPPGCKRVVIGPPDGDPTGEVRAVEAVVGMTDDGMRICVLVALDDGELERLAAHPAVWLTFAANQIPPFALHVADGAEL
jgi:hypothetical protein